MTTHDTHDRLVRLQQGVLATSGPATLVVVVFVLSSLGYMATNASGATSILVLIASLLVVGFVVARAGGTVVDAIRNERTQRVTDLEERAARAEEAVDTATRLAVVQERTRIAREMHDIVAHGISVMSVQAAAGQAIAPRDPHRAISIFADIEGTGREALTEMRRMLGVLRNGDRQTPGFAPAPTLHNLDGVIDHCVHAGLPIDLTTTGEPQRLAPGIELAVYRIVQEALTNALKHGGNTTTASVSLHYGPTEVAITIADTGKGAVSSLTSTGSGNGLIGMKERVDAYHGDFSAGPKPGGGYQVRARFPLDQQTNTTAPNPRRSPTDLPDQPARAVSLNHLDAVQVAREPESRQHRIDRSIRAFHKSSATPAHTTTRPTNQPTNHETDFQ